MTANILTAERVRELLDYQPETGTFTWIVSTNSHVRVGNVAGSLDPNGYLRIGIDGRQYWAHRLAWLHAHGKWPTVHADNINGDKADNRLINLREVTNAENLQNQRRASRNSSSGFLGVSWYAATNQWHARIGINGKQKHLGFFPTAELAHKAYLEAKRQVHSTCTI